ncbi:MAG TPA: EscU/YscU/HrcU family type III secretion system export apparatus switch protein [Dermatophilaceae bacterium]
MTDKSQKTEKPTPQRRKQAHRDGQVPRSADITAWLTVLSFSFLGPMTMDRLRESFATLMALLPDVMAKPEPSSALEALKVAADGAGAAITPMLASAMGLAILGGVAQGGLKMSPKRFQPKFEHLNVGKGVKRWFSVQAAWGLVKTLLKFGLLGWVAWVILSASAQAALAGGHWSLSAMVATAVEAAFKLIRTAAFVGLVIAAFDYLVERRRVNKGMMMSLEEVKREHRQSEGDPYQKGALRRRQREISQNRMMADIANADVVLVNPTHVAVALKYEPGSGAPTVVAKGAGVIAAKIREEAEKHRVPMVADIPLARLLFKACEIGQEIPVELYDAVARVLAFIMALRRRGSGVAGVHTVLPTVPAR